MALITLPVGNVLVPWIGPATTLAGQPWFTAANLAGVFRASDNRLGYTSNVPGAAFPGFAQVLPTAAGAVPNAYIFVIKVAFALDSALIGQPVTTANAVRLVASFPAGGTSPAPLTLTLADQPGTYALDGAFPASGVTGLAYAKSGVGVVALPVTLALGDTLTVTGTTVAGTAGLLTLLKQ